MREVVRRNCLYGRARGVVWSLGLLGAGFALLLALPVTGSAQSVDNTAVASYTVGGVPVWRPSNTLSIPLGVVRTDATLELWRHAPAAAGSTVVTIGGSECSSSGSPVGPFSRAPGPTTLSGAPIALGLLDALPGTHYALGEAVFIRVFDPDQNRNALLANTVLVQVSASGTGDSVLVRLQETGPETGEFTGWVQTSSAPGVCTLEGDRGASLTATYTDLADATDVENITASIQPLSLVFDAASGDPVSGATIRLVEEPGGVDALPVGDDGLSPFPATITSGGTASDETRTYVFDPGTYRYPYVPAGTYRLEVTPPPDYVYPSVTDTASIQALAGGPYTIVPGSRGETFTLAAPTAIDIDVPLDPASDDLFLSITSNKEIVGAGDFLQYDVRLRNPGTTIAPTGMTLRLTLPVGFRYREGTATVDGVAIPDPTIGPDGRTLDFVLGATPSAVLTHVRVVAEVTPSAPLGEAAARASSTVTATLESHAAHHTALVRDDLFSAATFIVGQVALGSCRASDPLEGVPNVRVYLEDGTYALTDSRGLYQFEGVEPGVHVVQVDADTLPPYVDLNPCSQTNRFAGGKLSQFVDLQPGTLWRADFAAVWRAPTTGYVNQRLSGTADGGVISYELEMHGRGVPIRRLSSIVTLPDGVEYEPGSSMVEGAPAPDPAHAHEAVVHRLGDTGEIWARRIEFRARVTRPELYEKRLITRSFANFRTPSQPNQRTPEARVILFGDSRSSSGTRVVETVGLRPGEEWTEGASTATAPEALRYDAAWLESARAELVWLAPGPDFSPKTPNANPLVAHPADHPVEIELNGQTVDPLHLDVQKFNAAKTVALSQWRGLDLREGPNRFRVIERDPQGRTVAEIEREIHYPGSAVNAVLVPESSRMLADGRSPIVVAMRFTDRWGEPAREGTVGTFSVGGRYTPLQERDALKRRALAGLAPDRPEYTLERDGLARIELAPSTESGSGSIRLRLGSDEEVEVRFWVQPESREWVLVGLAESTFQHTSFSGDEDALEGQGWKEGWDVDQRVSFFAKGPVADHWLLTFAYDSKGRDGEGPESLDGEVDPQLYYPLYGSENEQDYEAPTSDRLYAKLERSNFFALYGDYETDLTEAELSRYSRSLTGFKTEYEGEHVRFRGFATHTNHGYIRDQIRGDGTSGLYRLSREDVVRNSEKVTIEVRSRFRTEEVLRSESRTRHTDYDIDYDRGTLFFREPVPSQESFDPVFIVIEYESDDDRDESMVAGGRGAVSFLDDRLEFGSSVIHEGTTGRDGELLGADLRYELARDTSLRAEAAWTNTRDGALDVDGSAYLAEVMTRNDWLEARAYVREQQVDFGLGQQSVTETATRKLGAQGRLHVNERLWLLAEGYRQTNLDAGNDRDLLESRLQYQESAGTLYGGFRWARDQIDAGGNATSSLLLAGGSYNTLGDRLRLRADGELALGGADENVDFPSRIILGSDYDIVPQVTAYVEQEFGFGDEKDTSDTRAGLRATPWTGATANTSIEQGLSESGARLFANLGLTQSWQVTPSWSVDVSLDRTATLRDENDYVFDPDVPPTSGSRNDDFTAVSLGSTYRDKQWSWTSRIETRLGDREDRWNLFAGFYRELKDGIGVSARVDLTDSRGEDGEDASEGELGLGFVYRPLGSRWLVLDRTELRLKERDGGSFEYRNRKLVNNLHVNLKWSDRLQISMQYGAKYLLDKVEGEDLDGYVDLYGIELRRDLNNRWDLGAHAKVRRSWKTDVYDTAYGVSLGYKLATNLWGSVGYNFTGFRDDDFSGADYIARGPFVRFRYKFDQETIKDILDRERLAGL